MRSGIHLGIQFHVWNGQQGWFWLIVRDRRDTGIVGAVAKEADAIREARASIEEMSSDRRIPEDRPNV
jgi:hypothetical protein